MDWAASADPVLIFEAIGGMGKSMVTWEWITKHTERDRTDWAGILWYSFYERGADMKDFCVTALSYMTRRPREDLRTRPTFELASELLTLLRERPWLLVLDGLERAMVAYNRSDAAQIRDDEVEASEGATGGAPTRCIRPDDDDLLRQFSAAVENPDFLAPDATRAAQRVRPTPPRRAPFPTAWPRSARRRIDAVGSRNHRG
jgi:hypothetical protein